MCRNRGTHQRSCVPDYKTGSDRRVISSGGSKQLALEVSGKCKTGFDVFGFQIRKVLENLFLRHSRSQIFKHFVDGYAQATDARFSTSLSRLHGDPSSVVHGSRVCLPVPLVKHESPAISPSTPQSPPQHARPVSDRTESRKSCRQG